MSADIEVKTMKWHDGKDDPISWFFQNLDKPHFYQAEVLELAGKRLKAVTLQNWTNRQYIKPKMVGGKRRYSALEVAQISLAQPLVRGFGIDPTTATLVIVHGLLVFQRKLKSKEFSPDDVSHILGAIAAPEEEPIFIDARKVAPKLFETREALIVLPFGRLLNDLAERQRQLVELPPKMRKTA
jgi:hypothetical protein